MKLSGNEIVEILETLKRLGYSRFRFEQDGVKLEVDSGGGSIADTEQAAVVSSPAAPRSPTSTPTPTPPPVAARTAPPRDGLVAVTAPMTGTFYRASEPGAPPFVEVGATVAADETVCIVEVMKLFNSIAAGHAGTVVEVCAENESRVESGQPLIWIEPSR